MAEKPNELPEKVHAALVEIERSISALEDGQASGSLLLGTISGKLDQILALIGPAADETKEYREQTDRRLADLERWKAARA